MVSKYRHLKIFWKWNILIPHLRFIGMGRGLTNFSKLLLVFANCFVGIHYSRLQGQNLDLMNQQAVSAFESQDYVGAIHICEKAKRVATRKFGVVSPQHSFWNSRLGTMYMTLGQLPIAENFFLQAIEIDDKLRPDADSAYAVHTNLLGSIYIKMGRNREALALCKEAVKIDSTIGNLASIEFGIHLANLASAYKSSGLLALSTQFYLSADSLFQENSGANNKYSAMVASNLGMLYQEQCLYEKARETLLRGMQISHALGDTASITYAAMLINTGNLERSLYNYGLAESYFLSSIQIMKLKLGDNNPNLVLGYLNLASMYFQCNNFEKGKPLVLHLTSFLQEVPSLRSANDYEIMGLQASMHLAQEEYDSAALILKEVDQAANQGAQTSTGLRIMNLSHYGLWLKKRGNYSAADSTYRKALLLARNSYGSNHPKVYELNGALAVLYYEAGLLEDADSLFREVLSLVHKDYEGNSKIYSDVLFNYLQLCLSAQKWEQMPRLLEDCLRIKKEKDLQVTFSFPSNARRHYWVNGETEFYELLHGLGEFLPRLSSIGYEAAILNKNILLRCDTQFKNAIHESNDPILIQDFETWLSKCRRLNSIESQLTFEEREADRAEVENLEKSMLKRSIEFFEEKKKFEISAKNVIDSIPEGAIAIEFVALTRFKGSSIEDSSSYGAYILFPNNDTVRFVPLTIKNGYLTCPLKRDGQVRTRDMINASKGVSPTTKEKEQQNLKELYECIWRPLDPFLKGAKDIYYSPSGILHGLPFATFIDDRGIVLGSKYHLHQIGTTADIAKGEQTLFAKDLKDAVVFGGIEYGQQERHLRQDNKSEPQMETDSKREVVSHNEESELEPWPQLEETEKEALMLTAYLNQVDVFNNTITGFRALEESFKALGHSQTHQSPSLIHIATHGFSNVKPEKPKSLEGFHFTFEMLQNSTDPLDRSGLIFSGANRVWLGGEPIPGVDDGILSAAEIANMDLRDTKLVVLSACQSGLGEIQGTEGVFGLQRAFKLAGVELILATLWQVPDAETAEFMELFYTAFLKDGLEVRDAFFKAQAEMRERYRDEPYLWGAFVLLE